MEDCKELVITPHHVRQLAKFPGSQLIGKRYLPLFNYFPQFTNYRIWPAKFVTNDSGTGVVHIAPGFGEDDYQLSLDHQIIDIKSVGDYCPIDEEGKYLDPISDFKGMYVRDANGPIIKKLTETGSLIAKSTYRHNYPFCWRTETPLIYRALPSFFIKVTALKDQLVENNKKINWVPANIGKGRFHQWLSTVKDWGVSRSRYFGTPLPVWMADDGEMLCVSSIEELKELAGRDTPITDLHREFIDNITICKGNKIFTRVEDVFDCWFESGCVPLGQRHYPFENNSNFPGDYLAEFICEGLDQTRGWFYTLMVISTALFNIPAFGNVICSGIILAEDGKKLSKKHGNYITPQTIFQEYGADALRLYLLNSPSTHAEPCQFRVTDLDKILRKPIQLYYGYSFLVDQLIKNYKAGHPVNLTNQKPSSCHILDEWIRSRLINVVDLITQDGDKYEVWRIPGYLFAFMEDLTNWYIKLNRSRLRGIDTSIPDHHESLITLFQIIFTLVKVMAPFIPFLSEEIYSGLSKFLSPEIRKASVFLEDYPRVSDGERNIGAEEKMTQLQKISEMVRLLRQTGKVTTSKFPLSKVKIAAEIPQVISGLKELELFFLREINALKVEYITDPNILITKLTGNMSSLGKKHRKSASMVKKFIDQVTDPELVRDKLIMVGGKEILIEEEDFTVNRVMNYQCGKGEFSILNEGILVIIDTTRDESCIAEYRKRLFVTTVQNIRKETNLKPWDKIGIYYESSDSQFRELLNSHIAELRTTFVMADVGPADTQDLHDPLIWEGEKIIDLIPVNIILRNKC